MFSFVFYTWTISEWQKLTYFVRHQLFFHFMTPGKQKIHLLFIYLFIHFCLNEYQTKTGVPILKSLIRSIFLHVCTPPLHNLQMWSIFTSHSSLKWRAFQACCWDANQLSQQSIEFPVVHAFLSLYERKPSPWGRLAGGYQGDLTWTGKDLYSGKLDMWASWEGHYLGLGTWLPITIIGENISDTDSDSSYL